MYRNWRYQDEQRNLAESMTNPNHVLPALLALFVFFFSSAVAYAGPKLIEVQSGDTKVAILELYTSEGCSSCPPADQFVSQFIESDQYPQQAPKI